jgi:hypothetical protein
MACKESIMKPLKEMTNAEFADLVEYVSSYQTEKLRTNIDFKRVSAILRGEAVFPEGYTLFERTGAFELMKGPSFMFSVYEQMIERLQPPTIDLTEEEVLVFKSIASKEPVSATIFRADSRRFGKLRKACDKLFDLGLTDRPHTLGSSDVKLTAVGQEYLESLEVSLQPQI